MANLARLVCSIKSSVQLGRLLSTKRIHESSNSNVHSRIEVNTRHHSSQADGANKDLICVHYISKDGDRTTLYGKEGDNVMYLAQQNDIDIEGACEASLACCTCHVYVDDAFYDRLGPASEEEEDLLDMAPFLKANSRLSKSAFDFDVF